MKILVDENIPRMTVTVLRDRGHDVRDVRGTELQGSADVGLWTLAVSEQRLLITTDKGFTEYRAWPHQGILIIRLRQPNRQKIHERIMLALRKFQPSNWPGLLVVIRDQTLSTSRTARNM